MRLSPAARFSASTRKSGQALVVVLPIVLLLVILTLLVVNNGDRSQSVTRKMSAVGELRQKQEEIADMALKLVGEGIFSKPSF